MTLALITHPAQPAPCEPVAAPINRNPFAGVTVHRGISKSLHFLRRAEERGLREDVMEFVMTYGMSWQRMGATHLTVVTRNLPPEVRGCAAAAKAKDWIVVIAEGDVPITCYRRNNAVRFLKKKDKTRWSDIQIAERRAQKRGH
jgi:hypothetical protein